LGQKSIGDKNEEGNVFLGNQKRFANLFLFNLVLMYATQVSHQRAHTEENTEKT